jgi:hypothetical protein
MPDAVEVMARALHEHGCGEPWQDTDELAQRMALGFAHAALAAMEAEGFTVAATARPPKPTTSGPVEQE